MLMDPRPIYELFKAAIRDVRPSLQEYMFVTTELPTSLEDALTSAWNFSEDRSLMQLAFWFITAIYPLALAETMHPQEVAFDHDACDIVLLINADNYTAWNRRKVHYLSTHNALSELEFCDLVLSKHPKSGETWAHRMYVIKTYLASYPDVLEHEVDVCLTYAHTYKRNYHAWRHWTTICILYAEYLRSDHQLIQSWLLRLRTWCNAHVSDHSALHMRTQLYQYVADEAKRQTIIDDDLQWNTMMLQNFPGHESQWLFRRRLISHRLSDPSFVEEERTWASKRAHDSDGVPTHAEAQQRCVKAHERFLRQHVNTLT
jgi:protein prenyltransferase alpha subunit repeat containing protein 1